MQTIINIINDLDILETLKAKSI